MCTNNTELRNLRKCLYLHTWISIDDLDWWRRGRVTVKQVGLADGDIYTSSSSSPGAISQPSSGL
jgi:hypothetical protein